MGKFVYIYNKNQVYWEVKKKTISDILGENDDRYIQNSSDELIWVNGASGIQIDNYSIATGILQNKPIESLEYFSFKLCVNQSEIILYSDECASRTVWYIIHEQQLIVSSSQRVIIALIGNFVRNPQAISWMLTTGCLGPNNSWDTRISHLVPNTYLTFNKQKCIAKVDSLLHRSENSNNNLSKIFNNVFDKLPNYDRHTGLTLSGGYDSRAVLVNILKRNKEIRTYTWGSVNADQIESSDAQIARITAKSLDTPFNFLTIDTANRSGEDIMNAFLLHGEGRVDHLNTFFDGLDVWKKISREGIKTIIRSDEAFGWINTASDKDVRISLDLNTTTDYKNLEETFLKSDISKPEWTAELRRGRKESHAKYRDRLYRQYRIPYILSALQDLMLSYVEIVNPLLHPYFLDWAASQSDRDRSDKKRYKEYVKKLTPKIPFALTPSVPEPEEIINSKKLRDVIYYTLRTDKAKAILGEKLINEILDKYKEASSPVLESSRKRRLKNSLPFWLKKVLRNSILPYNLAHNRLVLRAYIIVKMDEIIRNDIKLK